VDVVSLYDYEVSKQIDRDDPPFASLIMAALRKADSDNAELLRRCWPGICDEMQARYNAPGGALAEDDNPRVVAMRNAE
jgi:hypothetical protein